MGKWKTAALVAGLALLPACSSDTFFTCEDSSQCGSGTCEVTGFCSFPDPACESGARYGDLAGPLSNTCVNPGTDASTSTEETVGVTSDSAATTTGSGTPDTASSGETTSPITASDTEASSSGGVGDSGSTGNPMDDGLVGWWPLDNDPEEGVLDATLNGNDGTCVVDCPDWNPEGFYSFDGGQMITIPGSDMGAPEFTVALWVRPDPMTIEVDPVVFTKPAGAMVRNSWGLHFNNVLSEFVFLIGNPTGGMPTGIDEPDLNGWHHYAGRFDGTTATLFQDGVPVAASDIPPRYYVVDDNDVYLGGDFDNGGPADPRFTGDVDDVRYYSRPLSDMEIAALATAPR